MTGGSPHSARRPALPDLRSAGHALVTAAGLTVACLATYLLVTEVIARVVPLLDPNGILGGMWAMIATIFVYRDTYQDSVAAALSRIAATAVSFVLCLAYILLSRSRRWGSPSSSGSAPCW